MHSIELYFFLNCSDEHTLESSSNEIEQRCVRTVAPYERQRKRDVLQYLPLSK